MTQRLLWHAESDHVRFAVEPPAPADSWLNAPLTDAKGAAVRAAPLLQCLDEGTATVDELGVRASHGTVAALSEVSAHGLGLPPTCPHRLIVESGDFNVTQPEFRFLVTFESVAGVRLGPGVRTGAFCEVDGLSFRLAEPQYSILEAVEAFNLASPQEGEAVVRPELVQSRLLQLAKLRELLGDAAQAAGDSYLSSFKVVVPTAFTLALSRESDGTIAIAPELCVAEATPAQGASELTGAVPRARQQGFQGQFNRFRKAKANYSLGEGWYVALPKAVEAALQVVREVQDAEPAVRRSFAKNPRAYLRTRLEGVLPEDELERVFSDDDYGERVRGVGLWEPKVLAWMEKASAPWLPSTGGGLVVGAKQLKVDPDDVEPLIQEVEQAKAQGQPSVRRGDVDVPATEATLTALGQLRSAYTPPAQRGEAARPAGDPDEPTGARHVLLIKDNLEEEAYVATRQRRAGVKGKPARLASSLLAHQEVALDWMQSHWLDGTSGALLADDMGLGKTLEVLAFLAWLQEQMDAGHWARQPLLIVAPTGLLKNWRDEIAKHLRAGGLGRMVLAWGPGLAELRTGAGTDIKHGLSMLDHSRLQSADVVLTTYETLRDYQHSFARVSWGVASFDEAQKIKNPETLMTDACKAVATKAAFAIAMTGTPVENRPADLWCILDGVQPAVLGPLKAFVKQYEGAGEDVAERRRQLRAWLVTSTEQGQAAMLRRLKGDHLKGLPKLEWHREVVDMPAAQAAAYSAIVAGAESASGDKGNMLRALHQMRAVSLHPELEPKGDWESFIDQSARLQRTVAVLDDVRARGEKALVFIESREFQPLLLQLLQERYELPVAPLIINGDVPGDRRKARVDEFQARPGFDVMLLSPRAGGVGLTLTAANHVIHLTRWWNPAVEAQCTDRVNRIGQQKPVHVWVPLARHPLYGEETFDLLLDALLEGKKRQSEETLTAPEASQDELSALFGRMVGR